MVAAAVDFIPGGSNIAEAFYAAIWRSSASACSSSASGSTANIGTRLYSLGDARRGLLYGAIAVLVVTVIAQPRMWQTSLGEFFWFLLVGLCIYSFVAIYRFARRY